MQSSQNRKIIPRKLCYAVKVVVFVMFLLSIVYLFYDIIRHHMDLNEEADSDALVNPKYLPSIRKGRQWIREVMQETQAPGCIVGVSIGGANVWIESFGFGDLENRVRLKRDTFMRIASITKTFVGVYAAKLVEAGRLSFDDSIYRHLSELDFPRKDWNGTQPDITVRQLLSHTAGIRKTNDSDATLIKFYESQVDRLEGIRGDALIFEPGTNFSYSNWGFEIVGAVIEKIIGADFVNETQRFYTEKLSLRSTRVDDFRIRSGRPSYFRFDPDWKLVTQKWLRDDMVAVVNPFSGGMVSTVEDLLKFGNVLLDCYHGNSSFLKRETLQEMWTSSDLSLQEYKRAAGEKWDGNGYGKIVLKVISACNYKRKLQKFKFWKTVLLHALKTFTFKI